MQFLFWDKFISSSILVVARPSKCTKLCSPPFSAPHISITPTSWERSPGMAGTPGWCCTPPTTAPSPRCSAHCGASMACGPPSPPWWRSSCLQRRMTSRRAYPPSCVPLPLPLWNGHLLVVIRHIIPNPPGDALAFGFFLVLTVWCFLIAKKNLKFVNSQCLCLLQHGIKQFFLVIFLDFLFVCVVSVETPFLLCSDKFNAFKAIETRRPNSATVAADPRTVPGFSPLSFHQSSPLPADIHYCASPRKVFTSQSWWHAPHECLPPTDPPGAGYV